MNRWIDKFHEATIFFTSAPRKPKISTCKAIHAHCRGCQTTASGQNEKFNKATFTWVVYFDKQMPCNTVTIATAHWAVLKLLPAKSFTSEPGNTLRGSFNFYQKKVRWGRANVGEVPPQVEIYYFVRVQRAKHHVSFFSCFSKLIIYTLKYTQNNKTATILYMNRWYSAVIETMI